MLTKQIVHICTIILTVRDLLVKELLLSSFYLENIFIEGALGNIFAENIFNDKFDPISIHSFKNVYGNAEQWEKHLDLA
jgi:hypothetical protein